MKKGFLSCFLSLSLLLTMMPTMAFATDETADEPVDTSEVCTVTDGCTLRQGHKGECMVLELKDEKSSGEPSVEELDENLEENPKSGEAEEQDSWEECATCSEDRPHMISTTADLNKIRTHIHTENDGTQTITGYFKLANDIVFSDEDFEEGGAFYNDGWGWTPIGHNNKTSYFSGLKFCGEFDGNQCTVENIHINRPETYWYNGLFAGIGGTAWVHDLNLSGFQFHADNMGALCGQVYGTDAVIENITVTD